LDSADEKKVSQSSNLGILIL